jgi:hypothetical protein
VGQPGLDDDRGRRRPVRGHHGRLDSTGRLGCAYLAGAVLIGLAANAWLGWWWLDPLIGLAVAAIAVREGLEAWRGEDCC